MAKQNQIVSFYLEHRPLIEMLNDEQAGRLLHAMLRYIFDGDDTRFEDDTLLNGVYTATKASALRQAKKFNADKSRSEKMLGNQNARKDNPVAESEEPSIDVGEPEDYIQVPEQ